MVVLSCQKRWLWVWRTQWHGFKKILSIPIKPKTYQPMRHLNPAQAWPGLVGKQCMLGRSSPSPQLSRPGSPIEVNDIHEYYGIQSHCCDSHLHATSKSPGRCPPVGGNKCAPCQGRGFGSHQNEFSRKNGDGASLVGAQGSHLPTPVLCKGKELGWGREVSLSCESLPFHPGELSHTSLKAAHGARAGFASAPGVGNQL